MLPNAYAVAVLAPLNALSIALLEAAVRFAGNHLLLSLAKRPAWSPVAVPNPVFRSVPPVRQSYRSDANGASVLPA